MTPPDASSPAQPVEHGDACPVVFFDVSSDPEECGLCPECLWPLSESELEDREAGQPCGVCEALGAME